MVRGIRLLAALVILALTCALPSFSALAAAEDDWAIYLYLCGADLETKGGAATADLMELVNQRLPDGVKVVIETGGARKWHNRAVDPRYLERYVLSGDKLARVWRGDRCSMGDGATLTDFVAWCRANYPARREALILWDHGGGSAGGLMQDELFGNDRLGLSELRQSLTRACPPDKAHPPLELVGFDCCLMATVDTAAALDGIARYMVASEETEPGCGWNYYGLVKMLHARPGMDGAAMGAAICETYMAGCRAAGVSEKATLSVIDMARLDPLLAAYDRFGGSAVLAACDDSGFFAEFGRGAKLAENYGGNTPSSGYTNMVDLGDLARQSMALLPDTARAVIQALEDCVVYRVNGSYRAQASGLSCYFAYDGNPRVYSRYADASASKSFSAFYDYMLNGTLDQDMQDYIIESLGYEGDEIQELDALSDFDQGGWQTVIDDEGYAVLTLSPATLATVAEVSFQLAYVDEDRDLMLFLGSDNDIDQDWERGVFRDNFRGVWGAIDGCLCHMEIEYQGDDYNLYNVPILLNGEPYQLKVVYDYDAEAYQILGALRGLNSQGLADRDLVRLRMGDIVTTLHYAASASGEDELRLIESNRLIVTPFTRFEEEDLGDGRFLVLFTLTDARGESTYADEVIVTVEGDDMYPEVVR